MEAGGEQIVFALVVWCAASRPLLASPRSKQVPVAEHATHAGTFKKYCLSLLPLLKQRYRQATYTCARLCLANPAALRPFSIDHYAFHVLINDNRTAVYMAVTPAEVGAELVFSFLAELLIQFEQEFASAIAQYSCGRATPLPCAYFIYLILVTVLDEHSREFESFLVHCMRRYNKAILAGIDTIHVNTPSEVLFRRWCFYFSSVGRTQPRTNCTRSILTLLHCGDA